MNSHTTSHKAPPRRRGGRGPRSGGPRKPQAFHAQPAPTPITRQQAEYDPRPVGFDTLGLEPSLIEGIRIRGFASTTPIQSAVIPIVMNGDDLIACADTGTGKTVAFLLPILNRMLRSRAAAPDERGFTRVLILAPTRELAVQIEDDVQGFIYHTDITSVAVYGGVEMGPQERALKSGVDIVVATPGR
ncbi:MAG TPA: DEAD/DEAH box helicase, partial [Vicinamibacterales bacterium]